jgi:hypothetical protein
MIGREPAGDKARILEIGDPHGDIEAVGDNIDEGVGQDQVELKLWVGIEECQQMRCDVQAAEGRRR